MLLSKVTILAILAVVCVQSQDGGPLPGLVGRWVEDDSKRTGLNDFLWARGVNWFKRQYAVTLTSWKYEQIIVYKNGGYDVNGFSKFSDKIIMLLCPVESKLWFWSILGQF